MKNYLSIFVLLLIISSTSFVKAQIIPPDTTTYWRLNESGVEVPFTRGPDSTLYKGQMIIRFREGALDYDRLLYSYSSFYFPRKTGSKKNHTLEDPAFPCDSNRGFPELLQHNLKLEKFYIDSETNIIKDTLLRTFLQFQHCFYLRRLTTASPRDKFSVTRRGDTIGCDLYNWMVLAYDTTVNPLILTYELNTLFPNDILFAEPDRHGGKLLHTLPSHPKDDKNLYDLCQWSLIDMINAPKAWDYEVGNKKILLAHFDLGADYRHPDLGGSIGVNSHVKYGEQFSFNTTDSSFDPIAMNQGHGTPCLGIIGALTNRNHHSVAGVAGGWGDLGGDPDEGQGCSLVILAASHFGTSFDAASDYIAAIFQASAQSDSSEFGYGVHVINSSIRLVSDIPAVHAAINYAFMNGVVHAASIANENTDETSQHQDVVCYPANYEEPWIIAVGGSQPNKTRIGGSDFGYTMDLLAPAGDNTVGDSVWSDQYGPIICSDSNKLGNFNMTFTTANIQQNLGHLEIDSPKFTYRGFGGNSAAAPHVTGSAGLILSHFLEDTIKLEPEDVAGILKASAFRPTGVNHYQLESAWGHLDIGHAFEMLDQTPGVSTENQYFISHFHFEDGLNFGTWGEEKYYWFPINWDPSIVNPSIIKKQYKQWQYLLNDNTTGITGIPFSYKAKVRTVAKRVLLPPMWDTTAPLYAWGRSGGIGEKSGWSFSQTNWQTGWSRVTSTFGGDSLNESIFQPHNSKFEIITAQYDVWAWNKDSNDYKTYIGHVPDDSLLGVNFTVFGRKDASFSEVRKYTDPQKNELIVSTSTDGDKINCKLYSEVEFLKPRLEIFDILGKEVGVLNLGRIESGWNTFTYPILNLGSGAYICRISGDNCAVSKLFRVIK